MSENWRVGGKVPLNVYEGDRPTFQCHTPEDAARIVELLNGAEYAEQEHQARLQAEAELSAIAKIVGAADLDRIAEHVEGYCAGLHASFEAEHQLRLAAEAARDRARDAFRVQGPCGHTENFLMGDEHGHFTCLICERDELKYRLQTWDDTHREELEIAVQARLAAEAQLKRRTGCEKCKGKGYIERHQPGMIHYETDAEEPCPSYHYERVPCVRCGFTRTKEIER